MPRQYILPQLKPTEHSSYHSLWRSPYFQSMAKEISLMTYTFKNTERNNEKASDFETKSLLYLIGSRKDSKEIEYVVFDCFNDVSGLNKNTDKIWDIQSKNEKSLYPKKIGKFLFTLFDNYISKLNFQEFIFFSPILKEAYKKSPDIRIYKANNFVTGTLAKVKEGLCKEVERVKGYVVEEEIESFIDKVLIVEDHQNGEDYIRDIVKFKNRDIKSADFYKSIFQDLRNIQSAKKNSYIENHIISQIKEILDFERHLSSKDIETLTISRIIGYQLFKQISIPIYFSSITDGLSIDEKKDLIQDCNSNLARALFNKNVNRIFWNICEEIITHISLNKSNDINQVFSKIYPNFTPRLSYLDERTIKYLIAIIIQGNDDNKN